MTKPKFRTIKPGTGYPGLTALRIDETREIVSMGVGKDVEDALMEAKRAKG